MAAIVAEAYEVFGRYASPQQPLNACVACCMDPALEAEMRQRPLRSLQRHHFYDYNCAAKDRMQPAAEILYFLPRLLELLAAGEELHHSIELSLDRLGHGPAETLRPEERAVLDRFALQYFQDDLACPQPGWRGDPVSVLLMVDYAGLDVTPLLEHWRQTDDPRATCAFVDARYWEFSDLGAMSHAFATDRQRFQHTMSRWVLDPATRATFVDRLMRPEFQALAQQESDRGCMPFLTMVDAVFDRLAEPGADADALSMSMLLTPPSTPSSA